MYIRVTYTPTTAEIMRGVVAHLRWRIAAQFVLPLLITICGIVQLTSEEQPGMGIPILAGGLLFPWLVWLETVRGLKRHGLVGKEWTVEISEDAIRTSMPDLALERPWSAFRTLRETEEAWLLGLSPKAAVVVPKRAMTDSQRQQFSHFLDRRRGAAG